MRYQRDGFSVEAAHRKGRELPDDHWYHDRPDLPPHTDFFEAAYRDLVTCRTPDGPVPWDKVMDYADRKRLGPALAEALWSVVRQMDLAERQWRVEQWQAEHPGG